nr:MAG TPA: hypothetical protein [Caudoviricetes sp.]
MSNNITTPRCNPSAFTRASDLHNLPRADRGCFNCRAATAAPALFFLLCFYFIRRYEEDFSFWPLKNPFLFLFASSFVESSCVLNFYKFNNFLYSSCYLEYHTAFINSLSDFRSFHFCYRLSIISSF